MELILYQSKTNYKPFVIDESPYATCCIFLRMKPFVGIFWYYSNLNTVFCTNLSSEVHTPNLNDGRICLDQRRLGWVGLGWSMFSCHGSKQENYCKKRNCFAIQSSTLSGLGPFKVIEFTNRVRLKSIAPSSN